MTVGIYCYKDLQDNDSIVYIGKDAYIHRDKRHKDHHKPSLYDAQQINRVLQNNPDRYSYEVLKEWNAEEHHPKTASLLERLYIRRYDPKFNFTKGGDGLLGYKPSNETKEKISKTLKGRCGKDCGSWKSYPRIIKRGFEKNGKQNYAIVFDGNLIKQSTHLERLEAFLDAMLNDKEFVWEDYPRIVKHGFQNGKRRYALIYKGKTIRQSIFLEKLEKELYSLINEVN